MHFYSQFRKILKDVHLNSNAVLQVCTTKAQFNEVSIKQDHICLNAEGLDLYCTFCFKDKCVNALPCCFHRELTDRDSSVPGEGAGPVRPRDPWPV